MKKYQTWEAIKMLQEDKNLRFQHNDTILQCNNDHIEFVDEHDDPLLCGGIKMCQWELTQKPVNFIEALNSSKKIRLEHFTINNLIKGNICTEEEIVKLSSISNNYSNLREVLENLLIFNSEGIQEILLEGKWYIEP